MAEQIKVPGVLKPGTGNYHSVAKDIIDDTLNNKSQAELNALFNQGKGIDQQGNPVDIGGRSYSAGTGLKLVGTVFSLSDDTVSKLNSVAVGVKAENNRGVWKAQIATIPVTLDVYINSTATTRPVVGQHYSTLYVKIKASEIVSTYEWNIEGSNAKITIVNDEILSQKLLDVLLYGSFHSDDIFYEDGIYEVVSDTSVEFTSSMKTAFYINGAANTTGGNIPNTKYEPYMNTSLQYTTVYHKGTKWLCNADVNEAVTTEEPNFSSTKWLALQEAVTGKGISHIIVEQALSTSASSVSDSWSQTPKSVTSTKRYLWEKTTIYYTDGTEYRIGAHIVGVYGDRGDDGTSVTIKGTYNNASQLPNSGNHVGDGYIINGDLYVWTTTNTWINAGRIKGEDGASAVQYYIHTAYADNNFYQDESHWTNGIPTRDYAYIGVCINTTSIDPSGSSGFAQYTWQLACGITYTIVLNNNIVPEGTVSVPMKLLKTIGSSQEYMSYSKSVNENITFGGADDLANENIEWTNTVANQRLYLSTGFKYNKKYTVVAYKDGKEVARTTLGITKQGEQGPTGDVGPRGAILRGPSEWKANVVYQGGNAGDDYQDMVYVSSVNKMYLCKMTHTSSNSNEPTTHHAQSAWSASQPWVETDIQDFIATKVFFAERAVIDNVDIRGTITSETLYVNNNNDNRLYIANTGRSITLAPMEFRMVVLPLLNNFVDAGTDWSIDGFNVSGTHIQIHTEPLQDVCNWAASDISSWKNENAATLYKLMKYCTLVCADPYQLIGGNSFTGTKHSFSGDSLWANDYCQGRFCARGMISRFVLVPPGQTLSLTSSIQTLRIGNDEVNCLVWNIDNASDFDTICMRMISKRYIDDYSHFSIENYNFNGSNTSIGYDGQSDWKENFLSYKGLDYNIYNDGLQDAMLNSMQIVMYSAGGGGGDPLDPPMWAIAAQKDATKPSSYRTKFQNYTNIWAD